MLFCMVVVFTSLKINMYEFVNGHYVTFHFETQRPTIACTCSSLFAIETNNNNNFEENERKKIAHSRIKQSVLYLRLL